MQNLSYFGLITEFEFQTKNGQEFGTIKHFSYLLSVFVSICLFVTSL